MNEELIRRLVEWSKGKPQPPLKLEMWIPVSCNLRCKFCDKWKNPKINGMSDQTIMKILKESNEIGIKDFVLSGFGEPFMKKNLIMQIIRKVKEYEMHGCLITNGTLITQRELELLVKLRWNAIFFSIEGYNASIHDSVVGVKGAFDRLIKTIYKLNEVKRKLKENNPWLKFNIVLARWNFKYIEKFIVLANKLGINEITFQSLMSPKKPNWIVKNFAVFKNKIKKSLNLAKELDIKTNLESFLNPEYLIYASNIEKILLKDVKNKKGFLSIPCYHPWWGMTITHEGRVGPCALLAERSKIDVFSSSMKDIWFNKFNYFREKIINKDIKDCMCCTPIVIENREIRKNLEKFL